MKPTSSQAQAYPADMQHFPLSIQRYLDDVVGLLGQEFTDKLDASVVAEVVYDSYRQLLNHVPRTAGAYLVPWARQRLVSRSTFSREPKLSAMLSMPTQRL